MNYSCRRPKVWVSYLFQLAPPEIILSGEIAPPSALAGAIKVHAINQLAKEAGIDRLNMYRMFAHSPAAPLDIDAFTKFLQKRLFGGVLLP
jgi:hypothetical protein